MRLGASTTIAVLVLKVPDPDPDEDTSVPRGQLLPLAGLVQLLGKLIRARRLVGAWTSGRLGVPAHASLDKLKAKANAN